MSFWLTLIGQIASFLFGVFKVKQDTRERFASWLKAANTERKDAKDLYKEAEKQKENLDKGK